MMHRWENTSLHVASQKTYTLQNTAVRTSHVASIQNIYRSDKYSVKLKDNYLCLCNIIQIVISTTIRLLSKTKEHQGRLASKTVNNVSFYVVSTLHFDNIQQLNQQMHFIS